MGLCINFSLEAAVGKALDDHRITEADAAEIRVAATEADKAGNGDGKLTLAEFEKYQGMNYRPRMFLYGVFSQQAFMLNGCPAEQNSITVAPAPKDVEGKEVGTAGNRAAETPKTPVDGVKELPTEHAGPGAIPE